MGGPLVELTTNIHGVDLINRPVYLYDVAISGIIRPATEGNSEVTVEFSKKTRDEYVTQLHMFTYHNSSFSPVAVERKDKARYAFNKILEIYAPFFVSKDTVFYDLQSLLYFMHKRSWRK